MPADSIQAEILTETIADAQEQTPMWQLVQWHCRAVQPSRHGRADSSSGKTGLNPLGFQVNTEHQLWAA